jgi:hypothetical protein
MPVGRKGHNLGFSLWGCCARVWTTPIGATTNAAGDGPRQGTSRLCITLWTLITGLELLADDFDRDRELDVAVQLGSHRVRTE